MIPFPTKYCSGLRNRLLVFQRSLLRFALSRDANRWFHGRLGALVVPCCAPGCLEASASCSASLARLRGSIEQPARNMRDCDEVSENPGVTSVWYEINRRGAGIARDTSPAVTELKMVSSAILSCVYRESCACRNATAAILAASSRSLLLVTLSQCGGLDSVGTCTGPGGLGSTTSQHKGLEPSCDPLLSPAAAVAECSWSMLLETGAAIPPQLGRRRIGRFLSPNDGCADFPSAMEILHA